MNSISSSQPSVKPHILQETICNAVSGQIFAQVKEKFGQLQSTNLTTYSLRPNKTWFKCLNIHRKLNYDQGPASWSSGNDFVFLLWSGRSEVQTFGQSNLTQCCQCLPLLQHFFEKSCVAQAKWHADKPRKLVTCFGIYNTVIIMKDLIWTTSILHNHRLITNFVVYHKFCCHTWGFLLAAFSFFVKLSWIMSGIDLPIFMDWLIVGAPPCLFIFYFEISQK